MKVLALFLVIALAQAAVKSVPCPANPKGTPTADQIYPFYKYSYEISKNQGSKGSVWIQVDEADRTSQGIWFRATTDASSALGASLHVKLTIDREGLVSDTDWAECSMTSGTCTKQNTFNLSTSWANITQSSKIWLTFFPECSTCSKTVEFSVETAWIIGGDPTWYPVIPLLNNTRTMVFAQDEGGWLFFGTTVVAPSFFYTSVVYADTAPTGDCELILYWKQGSAYNGTGSYDASYPANLVTPEKGDYLTQTPFMANTTGDYYLSTFIRTGVSVGETDFTIKVGFNVVPCASGSVLSPFILVALLPFLLSLWN